METVELTLTRPKTFVEDAEEVGLLAHEVILQVLQDALDERVIAIVDEEVKAYRAEHPHPPSKN